MSAERVGRLRESMMRLHDEWVAEHGIGPTSDFIVKRIHAALRADEEAARQETPDYTAGKFVGDDRPDVTPGLGPDGEPETPDPSAREAAEEWVALWIDGTSDGKHAAWVARSVLAQPRPVQGAIRDLLTGGDQ